MAQPYKICPRCHQPADLAAASCAQCGHVFRTQFVQPTQAFNVQPPKRKSAAPWILGCCAAPFILVAILLLSARKTAPHTAEPPPAPELPPVVRVSWADHHMTGPRSYVPGSIENLTDHPLENIQVGVWARNREGKIDILAAHFVASLEEMGHTTAERQFMDRAMHRPNIADETTSYTLPPHGKKNLIFNTAGYPFSGATAVLDQDGNKLTANVKTVDLPQ